MPNHSKWFNLETTHNKSLLLVSRLHPHLWASAFVSAPLASLPQSVSLMKDCKIASTFRIETICCKFIFTLNCAPLGREERQPSHRRVDGSGTAQQPHKFFSFFFLLSVLYPARENVIKNLGFKCWIIFSLKCSAFFAHLSATVECTVVPAHFSTEIAQVNSNALMNTLQLFTAMASFSSTCNPFR